MDYKLHGLFGLIAIAFQVHTFTEKWTTPFYSSADRSIAHFTASVELEELQRSPNMNSLDCWDTHTSAGKLIWNICQPLRMHWLCMDHSVPVLLHISSMKFSNAFSKIFIASIHLFQNTSSITYPQFHHYNFCSRTFFYACFLVSFSCHTASFIL